MPTVQIANSKPAFQVSCGPLKSFEHTRNARHSFKVCSVLRMKNCWCTYSPKGLCVLRTYKSLVVYSRYTTPKRCIKSIHRAILETKMPKEIYLLIFFTGSDYLHMCSPCQKHSLHIFTTVSYGKTTIFKGKYCISFQLRAR